MDAIPVTGVSELVLEVLDLDEALRFYRDVCGFDVVEPPSSDRAWLLAGRTTRIGLWTPQVGIADGRGGVHVHYAMHIGNDDFDAAVSRLRANGYDPHIELFNDNDRGR